MTFAYKDVKGQWHTIANVKGTIPLVTNRFVVIQLKDGSSKLLKRNEIRYFRGKHVNE